MTASASTATNSMQVVKSSFGSLPVFDGNPAHWSWHWKRLRAAAMTKKEVWAILNGKKKRKDTLPEHKAAGDDEKTSPHWPVFDQNTPDLTNQKFDAANMEPYVAFMETFSEECNIFTEDVAEGDGLAIAANLLKKFAKNSELAKLQWALAFVTLSQNGDEPLEAYIARSHRIHEKLSSLKVTLETLKKAIFLHGLSTRCNQPKNTLIVNGGELSLKQAEEKVTIFDEFLESKRQAPGHAKALPASKPKKGLFCNWCLFRDSHIE
eukprot:CAMPEP_0185254224 /NCGR_PEP_ID=MMETSP1359-20130426/2903_1 /TAXON_ID=552665 /ORGANISM="Bigelowiella longifila, Strain CCMP242" /LENGTH=264 /DNA_ID=CAMNT_0027836963 /DNA_START=122 /DNA_END=913 /DNA_ORIENTATION=+